MKLVDKYLAKKDGLAHIPPSLIKEVVRLKKDNPNIFWVRLHSQMTYFGHSPIYHVIFRPLQRLEFDTLFALRSNNVKFDRATILNECILAPKEIIASDIEAGIIEGLYDLIEQSSAWGEIDTLAEIQNLIRPRIGSDLANVVDMTLTTIFKGLTWKDTAQMDAYKTIEHICMAEQILGNPMDLKPKDEEAKRQKEVKDIIKRVNIDEDNKELGKFRTAHEYLTGTPDD